MRQNNTAHTNAPGIGEIKPAERHKPRGIKLQTIPVVLNSPVKEAPWLRQCSNAAQLDSDQVANSDVIIHSVRHMMQVYYKNMAVYFLMNDKWLHAMIFHCWMFAVFI